MKYISLIIALTLFVMSGSCNRESANSRSLQELKNKDSMIIRQTEMIIKNLNNNNFKRSKLVIFHPDKTTLECFYNKNQLKIFDIINIFENAEVLIDTTTERFYFGEGGYPIIYTNESDDGETTVQLITKDRDVISYIKKGGKIIYINDIDSFIKETKISAIMFTLINHILHFNNINLKVIQKPSLNSMPVITTLTDHVIMYAQPDTSSAKIQILKEDELLFFLDYSQKLDSINGMGFPWFKVSTEDKKNIGWIMGHFENVKYYSDGD